MDETHTIWIEKYRPARLADIVGQDEIVERLSSYVKSGNLPHLLFTGSAGVGKTTAAVTLAREFFGESWQMNFRELNASDERGIDVVRNQIKEFARTRPAKMRCLRSYSLTRPMRSRPMRRQRCGGRWRATRKTCRFILSCNYSSKIIDPIQSRCAIYRFRPLAADAVKTEIGRIAAKEGLTVTPEAMDAMVYIAQGDMRKAINALQGAAIISAKIEAPMVYAITSNARPEEIKELLRVSLAGDFEGAESLLSQLLHERGLRQTS